MILPDTDVLQENGRNPGSWNRNQNKEFPDLGRWIATDTMDVVQASLGWAGGFTGCRKIASTAQVLINCIHHIPFLSRYDSC